MRQITLDTETTGIGHAQGHRIIEIGCVEMIERRLTGERFHVYLNPERDIDAGAFKVHGISREFLADKPLFSDVFQDFLAFIEGAEVIIHNAPFDVGFLDAELVRAKWRKQLAAHCRVFDTLAYARQKYPGQRNTLDALCKRFDVKHFNRELHGALLDSEILAHVYLAMTGGQTCLALEDEPVVNASSSKLEKITQVLSSNSPIIAASSEEIAAHDAFLQFIQEQSGVNHFE